MKRWFIRIGVAILLFLAGRNLTKAETARESQLKHRKQAQVDKRDHHHREIREAKAAEDTARRKSETLAKQAQARIKKAKEMHDAPDDDAALAAYRKRLRRLQSRAKSVD